MNSPHADENEKQPVENQIMQSDQESPSADPETREETEPEQDPIEYIKFMLESKSTAKQTTFKHLEEAFSVLCHESKWVINELNKQANPADEDVTLHFKKINKHEFQLKLAGDVLIFVMHTNIVTFDDEHPVIKSQYVSSNEVNRYFGQINIYNFMFDSLRYNRGHDPGYLIGRLMVNHENRFFMEGEPPFVQNFGDISEGEVTKENLQLIVKLSLKIAIRNDLIAPPYNKVRSVTLNQKIEHAPQLGGGQKIGFRMSYENRVE